MLKQILLVRDLFRHEHAAFAGQAGIRVDLRLEICFEIPFVT